jgi:hypothetical protein
MGSVERKAKRALSGLRFERECAVTISPDKHIGCCPQLLTRAQSCISTQLRTATAICHLIVRFGITQLLNLRRRCLAGRIQPAARFPDECVATPD